MEKVLGLGGLLRVIAEDLDLTTRVTMEADRPLVDQASPGCGPRAEVANWRLSKSSGFQ